MYNNRNKLALRNQYRTKQHQHTSNQTHIPTHIMAERGSATRRRVELERSTTKLAYESIDSKSISVTGSFESFQIEARSYCPGITTISKGTFANMAVLNLSELFRGLFDQPGTKGMNVFEMVKLWMKDKWESLREYDLYTLAIDLAARERGQKRVDLPNVNFCFTILFLQIFPGMDNDFIVCDPIVSDRDSFVRLTNYSEALRSLKRMAVRVQTHPNTTGVANLGLDAVIYQRGTGTPNENEQGAIERATGLTEGDVVHVHLVPGKHASSVEGGNCYQKFNKSVATVLHQFSILDQFTKSKGMDYINKIKIVLDPFSAYSAFTAVAVLGYGIENMCQVMTGRYVNRILTFTPIDVPVVK